MCHSLRSHICLHPANAKPATLVQGITFLNIHTHGDNMDISLSRLYAIIMCLNAFAVACTCNDMFTDVSDIYESRFSNCTVEEETRLKCLKSYSACLARTDTIERMPFCLCIFGYSGSRCETHSLPVDSMTLPYTMHTVHTTSDVQASLLVAVCIVMNLFIIIILIIEYRKLFNIRKISTSTANVVMS